MAEWKIFSCWLIRRRYTGLERNDYDLSRRRLVKSNAEEKLQKINDPFTACFAFSVSSSWVSAGTPWRGGDVALCVFDVNQPSLPTPFSSVLVSVSVFMSLSTTFHFIILWQLSTFSLCSSGLISALLVLSTICLFVKVSFSPGIVLCGLLG